MTCRLRAPLAWAAVALLHGACSRETAAPEAASAPVACSVAEGQPAAAALQAATEWRALVENGPLYRAAAAHGALGACVWQLPADGAWTQAYSFRNGNNLQVQRDTRIEYSNQTLSLAEPPAVAPEDLLRQAERASFGDQGCGIDWQAPPERAEAAGTVEWVYRGTACNCQARIRKDAAGRAVGLTLRSAC